MPSSHVLRKSEPNQFFCLGTDFLEVVLSAFTAPRSVSLDGSFLGAAARVCLQCGENVVSGMMYALLGVSAITRVSHSVPCVLL